MKILSIYGIAGSNEFQNELPEAYSGSKSFSFMHSWAVDGEKIAFEKMHSCLDGHPEMIVFFQFYNRKGDIKRHMEFLEKAKKGSRVFLYVHDSPKRINMTSYWDQFEKVYLPNYERMLTMRERGIQAEFLPMPCSSKVHILLTPFRSNIETVPSICFFIQWLNLDKEQLSFGCGGPDRKEIIRKLLESGITVNLYGPPKVLSDAREIPVGRSKLICGTIDPYHLYQLPAFRVFFNGIFNAGELSINHRFYEVLGIGGVQLYPECPYFDNFCMAFFGEKPKQEVTPVILYKDDDDFVNKAKMLLQESNSQSLERRKKATLYREQWTTTKMVRVIGGDEKNPSLFMGEK